MSSFRVLFYYSAFFYFTVVQTNEDVKGYFWQDYRGTIPLDALPGGSDGNGNKIYIGQIKDHAHTLPGQINTKQNEFYYVYPLLNSDELLAETATKDFKIFCTQYPERFEWIKTKTSELKNLALKKHLISAGNLYDPSVGTVYIGKALEIENVSIGVIITNFTNPDYIKSEGLHVRTDIRYVTTYDTFEVLSYNPDVPSGINNVDVKASILKTI